MKNRQVIKYSHHIEFDLNITYGKHLYHEYNNQTGKEHLYNR